MNQIRLENMRFYAFHGAIPEEQLVGSVYEVSVVLGFDFSEAAETDDLCKTINYAEVYELVKAEMSQPSKLIEHLTRRIQNSLLTHFTQIEYLEISVSKCHPPVVGEMDKATVVLYFKNEHT